MHSVDCSPTSTHLLGMAHIQGQGSQLHVLQKHLVHHGFSVLTYMYMYLVILAPATYMYTLAVAHSRMWQLEHY